MKIAGTPVKDADGPMVVKITKSDVRLGSTKNAKSCAAAKALCRQGAEEASVHFSRAYIKKDGVWIRFGVPLALRNEVLAFDRGGEFSPGEYWLKPVQPTVRLEAAKRRRYDGKNAPKTKKRATNSGTKIKRPYHVVSGVRARMQDEWWKDQ
jgi:hypothetical protein